MELNKKNIKKIIGIMSFGIILYFVLQNITGVKTVLFNIFDILSPFFVGAGLAFVLNIPLNFFEKKLFRSKKSKRESKFKRPISILLSFILISLIIGFIIKLVIPQLLSVIYLFVKDVPRIAYNVKEYAIQMTIQYPDISNQIKSIEVDWNKVTTDIINFTSNLAKGVLTSSIGLLLATVGSIFNTIISIVFAVYILNSKEKLKEQMKRFLKAYVSEKKEKKILELCSLSKNTFNNFITGQFLEAIILGSLCFCGMLILRLPFATTISVLIGVTALIPIIGAFIGAIIGAILILSISPIKAIIFLVFLIILQQIETNVIYPKVVGNSVGLPGIWVLMAVAIGGSLFGILGLIIGLPLVSVFYTILKCDIKSKLENKGKIEC